MKVLFDGKNFVCRTSYENRGFPREAGFRWSATRCEWYTPYHGVAARLRQYASDDAKREINRVLLTIEPWTGPLSYPKELSLYSFQEEAIRFALSRNRAYLAKDPGLGKTIDAAVIANTLRAPVVYICPPFLTRNVAAEFSRWDTRGNLGLLIVADSMLYKPQTIETIKDFIEHNSDERAPILFVDEAHRYKSKGAKRSKALFGEILPLFDRVIYLSGTPMPNRPIELYPILSNSAPETIDYMSEFDYAKYYCAATHNGFGWDYSGSSNIGELAAKVKKKFMIRMRKSDVLKELPPKTEEMIIVGDEVPKKLAEMNSKLLHAHSPEDLMKGVIGEEHLSTYRRELGLFKAKEAVKYLKDLLDESDESVLVFAIHTAAIDELTSGLQAFRPLVITGQTPMKARQEIVDEFQNDPGRRVFIGNIQAAGTGFTLTKATRVVFAEFSWVPADNEQASDRAHRISQKDNVFVQYLVYRNSIDANILQTIFAKKKVINHV